MSLGVYRDQFHVEFIADASAAFESGQAAARKLVASLGEVPVRLLFAFCNGGVDEAAFLAGVRSITGETVPVVGGSTIGVITNHNLDYEHPACALAACVLGDTEIHLASADGVHENEFAAGKTLGEKLSAEAGDAGAMLLLYDSLKTTATATTPPVIVGSPALLSGLEQGMGGTVPTIGAGLISGFAMSERTQIFTGDQSSQGKVLGLLFNSERLQFDTAITHGCTPLDGVYHTVTRSEGPCLFEVDGRPVTEVIDEMYGDEEWRAEVPVRRLTIGVNHGEKFGDLEEHNFVNRLIAGVLPEDRGVGLFEPDLAEGTEFLFMVRDPLQMIRSAREKSRELVQLVEDQGRRVLFALYINCAGRASVLSCSPTEEAAEVMAVMNDYDIPLLGLYTGVEIAPLLGRARGLDWTGVLWLVSAPQ